MSDEALMQKVQQKDEKALHQLMNQYMAMVYAYSWRMVGNRADAEEITQETFVKLWYHATQWQAEKGAVLFWLHRIAHNLCMDFFRAKRLNTVDISAANNMAIAQTQDGIHQLEQQQHISHLLLQLPERQRSALILCYYQGLSNQEAADILTIHLAALESLLARARKKLKQYHEATTF